MNSVHQFSIKGGDPAAPSDTATLLRLHPNHLSHLRRLAPKGYPTDFGCYKLSWCDGRCTRPGTYSPRHADPRLLAIPASCRRVAPTIRTENGFMRLAPPRGLALFVPSIVARVWGHKGHDDLTSSPPSSGLSPAVTLECPT